jgi:23S rRNA (adenine2503-C2)-methyltransferase
MPAVVRYLDNADRQMHVTIEYVMLKGVNDQIYHAQQLAKLVGRYVSGRAKINLIPFNTFPTTKYTCSEPETIRDFAEILRNKNIITTVRKTRGPDIFGACGQLAGDVLDKTKRRQKYLQEMSNALLVEQYA